MKRIITAFTSTSRFQQATISISILLLLISFTQPAFYIDWPEDPAAWSDSWALFFFGWTFPLGGALVPFLFWCANPIYIFSIIFTIKGKVTGLYLSIVATVIAFSFSQIGSIMTSESGRQSKISSLELGYKLWVTSFLIMSIGTAINLYIKRRNAHDKSIAAMQA